MQWNDAITFCAQGLCLGVPRPVSLRARKESAVTISLPAYFQTLYEALKTISESAVEQAVSILHQAYLEDRTIFVIGNGRARPLPALLLSIWRSRQGVQPQAPASGSSR